MSLYDKFGRQISDLRISVTDRCNFRCVYCRSADPENYRDHDEILSWAELRRLAGIFVGLGIRKVRITGGEPLVREGVEEFIAHLKALGVQDLSITTNGHLLAERCDRLIAAGLQRINISLDSLDANKFERITRTRSYDKVMEGIEAVQKSRLAPAKVNAVLVRGLNDDEVEAFAAFARERGVIMRFIEFMPLDADRHWSRELGGARGGGLRAHPCAVAAGANAAREERDSEKIPVCGRSAGRDRADRAGDASILRTLFAHTADGGRQDAHMSVQQGRSQPARTFAGECDG